VISCRRETALQGESLLGGWCTWVRQLTLHQTLSVLEN